MNELLLRGKVSWCDFSLLSASLENDILACWFLYCSLLSIKRGFVKLYSKVLVWAVLQ